MFSRHVLGGQFYYFNTGIMSQNKIMKINMDIKLQRKPTDKISENMAA